MEERLIRVLIFNWIGAYNSTEDAEQDQAIANDCRYSLIENYVPDSPGWTGNILTVVFGFYYAIANFRILGQDDPLGSMYLERIEESEIPL